MTRISQIRHSLAECLKYEVHAVIHPFRMQGGQSQSCCSENDPFTGTVHRYQKQDEGFPELLSLFLRSHPISISFLIFIAVARQLEYSISITWLLHTIKILSGEVQQAKHCVLWILGFFFVLGMEALSVPFDLAQAERLASLCRGVC